MADSNQLSQYQQLERELAVYGGILGKAADTIVEKEVSEYPVFAVHQQIFDVGIPLIEREKTNGNWSVNASSLEEFVTKQIIQPDRVESFQEAFKPVETHVCLFVLSELGANFIFYPRQPKTQSAGPLSKN